MTEAFTIKPLVWEDYGHDLFAAKVCDAAYQAQKRDLDEYAYWVFYGIERYDKASGRCDTLEAAKAACEAHHKSRIMEYLEPVDDPYLSPDDMAAGYPNDVNAFSDHNASGIHELQRLGQEWEDG